MHPTDKTTIEIFEEPDHLFFIVTRETGWLTIVGIGATLVTGAFFSWPNHKLFALFVLAMGLFGWITAFTQGAITRLDVSERGISAHGN